MDDDAGLFAGAGEEANFVNWSENPKDTPQFRLLETSVFDGT
jgi:hypothetical protein